MEPPVRLLGEQWIARGDDEIAGIDGGQTERRRDDDGEEAQAGRASGAATGPRDRDAPERHEQRRGDIGDVGETLEHEERQQPPHRNLLARAGHDRDDHREEREGRIERIGRDVAPEQPSAREERPSGDRAREMRARRT